MTSFADLGVPADLVQVLESIDRPTPFPIQRDTLPDSLAGRDVLGRGRTGSGKTLAFSLPLVERLRGGQRRPGAPRGLVLAPTRELATQILATIKPLADAAGLKATTIFGGVSQRPQEKALAAGVDIVVACPGRLEDLMKQGVIRMSNVEIAILDEADHMADLGFLPGVTRIMKATAPGGQRLLFSATLDNGVDGLVRQFLRNEVRHSVDESSVPAAAMTHRVLLVADDDRAAVVDALASGTGRRILFTRTKHQAKRTAKQLTARGIPAVDLQGNLSQNARERNLAAFSADPAEGGVRVLVATDVAARGVHVDGVELVVHVEPPAEHKAYLHRSGRTARAGAEGTVVTLVTPGQKRDASAMLRQAKISVPFEEVNAASAAVAELVGERAPLVKPDADALRAAANGGRGRPAGGGRGSGAAAAAAASGDVARPGRRRGGRGTAKPDAGAGARGGASASDRPASDRSGSSRSASDRPAREAGAEGAGRRRGGRGRGGAGQGVAGSAGQARSESSRSGEARSGQARSGQGRADQGAGRGSRDNVARDGHRDAHRDAPKTQQSRKSGPRRASAPAGPATGVAVSGARTTGAVVRGNARGNGRGGR